MAAGWRSELHFALCLRQLSQCLVEGVCLHWLRLGWEHGDFPLSPGQPHSLRDFVEGLEPSKVSVALGMVPVPGLSNPSPMDMDPIHQALAPRADGGEPAMQSNPSTLVEPSLSCRQFVYRGWTQHTIQSVCLHWSSHSIM